MKDMLLIDKPVGWTSFDVVAKLRGAVRAQYIARGEKPTKRQLRVGHAGTLDPFATGLLVVLLGDACKQAGEFLKLDKVYEATFVLGATSTTGDPEGELTPVSDVQPELSAIQECLGRFTGEITQVPPVHSAIKIGGVRAYALARKGKPVEVPARQVHIYSLEVIDYTYPELQVRVHVGSGTYIRSLAQDMGESLGVGAYCKELRRTRIKDFSIDDALTVDEAVRQLESSL